jgi:hypothetical protein
MRTIETESFIVTFKDDPETQKMVFESLVEFFTKNEGFCGESIVQSDWSSIDGPDFLADMADKAFQFKVKYKE